VVNQVQSVILNAIVISQGPTGEPVTTKWLWEAVQSFECC